MAASQPPLDLIRQVCEFSGVSEGEAVILLRKNNNDINRAIDAYFQDPVSSVRVEEPSNEWQYQDNIPSFRIDADDTSTGALPAMSRPPSRADDQGNIIDLTDQHAAATVPNPKYSKEQEDLNDPDLQRAMAMSMGQEVQEQENGVTGMGQQFGPATREHYDPSRWAMTSVATSREIIEHPPPSKRRRTDNEPAFLRGSKETGYLGPLLSIYHGIPLAREALLLPSLRVLTYGYDPSWWSGSTDENRKSLSLELNENFDPARVKFLTEVQCLMAFLDGTNRAYGSVDALADLQALKNYSPETSFSQFLEAWKEAATRHDPRDPLTQIFSSTAIKDPNVENMSLVEKTLLCLEPPVNRIEGQLLVDLLDATVWDDTTDNLDDVWIQYCAEVFTMRLFDPGNHEGGLKLTTTAVWYPDRYMYECRDLTRQMRAEMQLVRKEISHCTSIQRRCEIISGPGRKTLKIREVLEEAAKASATTAMNRTENLPVGSELQMEAVKALESEIKAVLERVDRKVKLLEQRKAELQSQMRQIALQLTKPGEDPTQPPFRRYTLQGVSTRPDVTYIRRRNMELIQIEDQEETGSADEWQWWRLSWLSREFGPNQPVPTIGPVTQEQAEAAHTLTSSKPDLDGRLHLMSKVTEVEVIEAVRIEYNSVVLVYASDSAMVFQGSPLSQSLRQFIEQDNQSFANELHEESGEENLHTRQLDGAFEYVPPTEGQHQNGVTQEMTSMSLNSPPRDENGQPSPKRPKSSDEDFRPADAPPPYEAMIEKPEMQERKVNKIGLYAERMLEKYGERRKSKKQEGEGIHLEHSTDLPR